MICHGLQMLIKQNKGALGESVTINLSEEDSTSVWSVNKVAEKKARALYTESVARANILAIASFSRNFLPLLFNVFIASPLEKRGVLQSTIGDLASISDKKVVRDFFVSIMQKLLKATKEAGDTTRIRGAEPMDLSGPGKESVSSRRCMVQQDGDGSVRKKGYKVLAGLCKSKSQDADKVLSSFIGEIVLATKEANIKTRNTAYDILVQLGRSLKDEDPLGYDRKLIQLFTMIVGCLGGTTAHMRSAAITALARLIYEFSDLCHTIPELLPSVLLLLQSKSREVIKVRVIFEMLVRRCGLQPVLAVTPEQHVKLINHIRKMKERKEKKDGDETRSAKSSATTASIDGYRALVERHLEVEVSRYSRDGSPIEVKASGWQARILQHECDHLKGVLYVERMIAKTFRTSDNLGLPLPSGCPEPGDC